MDQQTIVADLEAKAKAAGLTIGEACRLAKVHPTTFSRWKKSERNPNPGGANLGLIERIRTAIAEYQPVGAAA